MFRHDTAEFHLQMFDGALSALCADVVSPRGNNRADTIRPYADGATELPMQKFRCANEGLKDTRHYLLYNPFIPSFRRISGWTCKLTGINHAERMNNTMFYFGKKEDRHD